MRRESRHRRCLTILRRVVVVGFAAAFLLGTTRAQEEDQAAARKVVAKVNGQPIYEDQLKPTVEKTLKTFRKFGKRQRTPDLIQRLAAAGLR